MSGGIAGQSREWTMRAWRFSTGPRTNALSSKSVANMPETSESGIGGFVICMKPWWGKRLSRQGVEPVVEIADDQGRQVGRLAKKGVIEQVPDLPVPLALGQTQVPVHWIHRPLRRLDHHDLGAARLSFPEAERDLVTSGRNGQRESIRLP